MIQVIKEERIHGNPISPLNIAQLETNVRAASTPIADKVWAKFEAMFD